MPIDHLAQPAGPMTAPTQQRKNRTAHQEKT